MSSLRAGAWPPSPVPGGGKRPALGGEPLWGPSARPAGRVACRQAKAMAPLSRDLVLSRFLSSVLGVHETGERPPTQSRQHRLWSAKTARWRPPPPGPPPRAGGAAQCAFADGGHLPARSGFQPIGGVGLVSIPTARATPLAGWRKGASAAPGHARRAGPNRPCDPTGSPTLLRPACCILAAVSRLTAPPGAWGRAMNHYGLPCI